MQEENFNMMLAHAEMWLVQLAIADKCYLNNVGIEGVNFDDLIQDEDEEI